VSIDGSAAKTCLISSMIAATASNKWRVLSYPRWSPRPTIQTPIATKIVQSINDFPLMRLPLSLPDKWLNVKSWSLSAGRARSLGAGKNICNNSMQCATLTGLSQIAHLDCMWTQIQGAEPCSIVHSFFSRNMPSSLLCGFLPGRQRSECFSHRLWP
jgi:hypothetical protein